MLVECATKEAKEGNDKITWVLIILVTHVVGAALYFFARRPKRRAEVGRLAADIVVNQCCNDVRRRPSGASLRQSSSLRCFPQSMGDSGPASHAIVIPNPPRVKNLARRLRGHVANRIRDLPRDAAGSIRQRPSGRSGSACSARFGVHVAFGRGKQPTTRCLSDFDKVLSRREAQWTSNRGLSYNCRVRRTPRGRVQTCRDPNVPRWWNW